MKSTDQILRDIAKKARIEKMKKAEQFNFKKNVMSVESVRLRTDQIDFLNYLNEKGFNKSSLIRNALDKEFKKRSYKKHLDGFKREY